MGSMTMAEMRQSVYDQFGECSGFLTDNIIDEFLKEGYLKYANLAECLIGYVPLQVNNGVAYYPPCFRELIWVDTGDFLTTVQYEQTSKYIAFRPASEAPESINIKYLAVPSSDPDAIFKQLSDDNSTTQLTENGDRAVIQFALSRSYRRDQRLDEAGAAMAEFKELASDEYRRFAPNRARPRIVTDAWSGTTRVMGNVFVLTEIIQGE